MKQFRNILFFSLLSVLMFSCEKHTVEYMATKVTGLAEFQLHYFVPLTAGTANNIYKIEVNGQVYGNNTAPLTTYNAVPSGGVGRFYTTKPGQVNIKLYKGTDLELVFDQNCELKAGKQNIFVYDFNQPPIVFDTGYPFKADVTDNTGTTAWIKFYNFLFESDGVTTPLKIQYQYQYTIDNTSGQKSDWLDLGSPVAFGETTGWIAIPVNKTVFNSAGTARIDYRAQVINQDGSNGGSLKVQNSSGALVDYSDWWTAQIGRRYHHIMSGMRVAKPNCAVRVFTAL